MKRYYAIFVLCLFSILVNGQSEFDPTISFLLPADVKIADGLEQDIKLLEEKIISTEKAFIQRNYDSLEQGINQNDSITKSQQAHLLNQLEFYDNLDFTTYIMREYANKFQKDLGAILPNALVKISSNKSLNEVRFLRSFSSMKKTDYIILCQTLNVDKGGKGIIIKPRFSIYSDVEKKVISVSELANELAYSTTLDADGKQITMNYNVNLCSQIQKLIVQNGDAAGRELNRQRNDFMQKIYEENITNDTIKGNMVFSGISINFGSYISGLYNPETKQFVAFFVDDYPIANRSGDAQYFVNIVYFERKSKKWKYKYIVENALSAASLTKEDRAKELLTQYKEFGYFNANTVVENEDFWDKKLYLKYEVEF